MVSELWDQDWDNQVSVEVNKWMEYFLRQLLLHPYTCCFFSYGILNLCLPLDSYPNHKIIWVNKERSKVHLPALSLRLPGALCALSWPPAEATLIITVLHKTTITILALLHDTVSTIRCLCLHKTLRLKDKCANSTMTKCEFSISIIYLPLLSIFV